MEQFSEVRWVVQREPRSPPDAIANMITAPVIAITARPLTTVTLVGIGDITRNTLEDVVTTAITIERVAAFFQWDNLFEASRGRGGRSVGAYAQIINGMSAVRSGSCRSDAMS